VKDPEGDCVRAVQQQCSGILDLLRQEQGAGEDNNNQSGELIEQLTTMQFVIFVLEQFLRTAPKKRPKILIAPMEAAAKSLATSLERIAMLNEVTRKRYLSSHRISSPIDHTLITMYKEAFQLYLMDADTTARRRSARKKTSGREVHVDQSAFDTTDFTKNITDTEGKKVWADNFGVNCFMVPWGTLRRVMHKYAEDHTEDTLDSVQCILDPNKTGYVSIFRFGNFLQAYGPIDESMHKAIDNIRSSHFQGYMSSGEVSKLLYREEQGTFISRLSRTKPDHVIVSYVHTDNSINHLLLQGCPGGFVTKNSKQPKTVTDIGLLLGTRNAYTLELMRAEAFFGDVAGTEAATLLQKWPRGTFLIRFDDNPPNLAISVVTYSNESHSKVEHYYGLRLQKGMLYYKNRPNNSIKPPLRFPQQPFSSLSSFIDSIPKLVQPLQTNTLQAPSCPEVRRFNVHKWRHAFELCGDPKHDYIATRVGKAMYVSIEDEDKYQPDPPMLDVETLVGIDGIEIEKKPNSTKISNRPNNNNNNTKTRDDYGALPDLQGLKIADAQITTVTSVTWEDKYEPKSEKSRQPPYASLPPLSESTSSVVMPVHVATPATVPRKVSNAAYGELPNLEMLRAETASKTYATLPVLQ